MAESVSVRCPTCRREHAYTPNTFPCVCGAPLTLPVLRGGIPVELKYRTWQNSWVRVRCAQCAREDDWPHPELSCVCGSVVRIPVERVREGADARQFPASSAPPLEPKDRPAFRPVTIRTTGDAVIAAAQFLRWLGYPDVVQTGDRPASGVDVRGSGVVAHVDPTTTPTALREIECVWLGGLNQSALAVFFSLAGYAREARTRADELQLPLFVMDLTGTPQPVNDPADELIRAGP